MTELGPFKGVVQPDPEIGPKRLRECKWGACASLKVPGDWTSGVYLGKLTAEREGFQLEEATFYSDSITDLPLLEAVKAPVVVNPDRRLRGIALKRGWPIESW